MNNNNDDNKDNIVTDEMISLVANYCNYDYSEVAQWSDKNILNAFHNVIKEMKNEQE